MLEISMSDTEHVERTDHLAKFHCERQHGITIIAAGFDFGVECAAGDPVHFDCRPPFVADPNAFRHKFGPAQRTITDVAEHFGDRDVTLLEVAIAARVAPQRTAAAHFLEMERGRERPRIHFGQSVSRALEPAAPQSRIAEHLRIDDCFTIFARTGPSRVSHATAVHFVERLHHPVNELDRLIVAVDVEMPRTLSSDGLTARLTDA